MKWWGNKLEESKQRLDHLLNNGWRAPKWKQMQVSNEIRGLRSEINHIEKLIENNNNA